MVKVKLGLFEGVAGCTVLPTVSLIFTMLLSIISIIVPQKSVVYISLLVCFIASFVLFFLSLLICCVIIQRSKNEISVMPCEKIFKIKNKTYPLANIKSCKYYICKWYAIPFFVLYKQGQGGLFDIVLISGKKYSSKFYIKIFLS
jgi:hypothetical protein